MVQHDGRSIGVRIQEERKLADLSQEQLGRAIGLDRTVVNKIENGMRKVSALELADIAAAIGVRMTDFFKAPTPALVSHRSSQGLDVADSQIDRLLAHLAREVEFVDRLAPDLFDRVDWGAVSGGWDPPQTSEDSESLAQRARTLFDLEAAAPLVDLGTRATQIGLLPFSRDIGKDTADAGTILLKRGGVSLINSSMKVGRRRLALAHEIGHYLIADEYSVDWRIAPSTQYETSLESRLDRFARALLLPRAALTGRWQNTLDADGRRASTITLASEFRVDMATLAKRQSRTSLVGARRRPCARERSSRL